MGTPFRWRFDGDRIAELPTDRPGPARVLDAGARAFDQARGSYGDNIIVYAEPRA